MRLRTKLAALAAVAPLMVAGAHADLCPGANTQLQLDQCAGKAFKTADTALNAAYNSVMNRLDKASDGRRLLIAAQKDWLAFRDGECAFEASGTAGGSAYPMVVAFCRAKLTEARTQALRALLACQEGDLSCPLPPR